jgi:hypothetical protein
MCGALTGALQMGFLRDHQCCLSAGTVARIAIRKNENGIA